MGDDDYKSVRKTFRWRKPDSNQQSVEADPAKRKKAGLGRRLPSRPNSIANRRVKISTSAFCRRIERRTR
jgi:hypothetical protein